MTKPRFALFFILTLLVAQATAAAHVVVKPATATTGSFQTFTMGVPNEKDVDVTELKLVIPAGLLHISPTVKPGWNISTEKVGSGEDAVVKTITWNGGVIPAGQRDDFGFSAKVPDAETKLEWKAYQTYGDGITVGWDQAAEEMNAELTNGPFSVTNVVDQSETEEAMAQNEEGVRQAKSAANRGTYLGIAGVAIGLVAVYFATRKDP